MDRWKIGWGVTNACNMHCHFCYSRSIRNSTELGLSSLIAFVDRNWHQIECINYGTAENSLSDKWFDLLSYIHQTYPSHCCPR
jgi:MoaA/NifB/PqqE/SkfB family radical SAM enzyme